MKRILLTLTAAIAAFPIWAAHPSHTNIWTGAGGDFNWNNAANWKDFATGGDWTPPTEATNKDAPAWNLVDFPADGTLVRERSGQDRAPTCAEWNRPTCGGDADARPLAGTGCGEGQGWHGWIDWNG